MAFAGFEPATGEVDAELALEADPSPRRKRRRSVPGKVTRTLELDAIPALLRAQGSERARATADDGWAPAAPPIAPPIQADGGRIAAMDPFAVHLTAQAGVAGSGAMLPHVDAIQQAFGHHDVRDVRAHVGGAAADAAAEIGARAYATGDDVAFAVAPDLRQAAHEAAHVVQQRGGVRLDGGVGRAGDVYEQHADTVADLVVRGESAESLLDTMAHRGAGGGKAVQRLTAAERAAARAHTVSDLTLEQIAHRIAYIETGALEPADATALSTMGFNTSALRFHHGEGDLQFTTLPALPGRDVTPVIAFRGTSSAADLSEDAAGTGVGLAQFTMNQPAIQAAIQSLGAGRGLVATGHSLGGAIAQIAACFYPDLIVSVVTFQSPGISREIVERLRSIPASERPTAHHHRVDGCIVDDAGDDFVAGDVTVWGPPPPPADTRLPDPSGPYTGVDPAHAHTTFPLLAAAGDDAEPWMRGGGDTFGPAVDPEIGATRREGTTADPSFGRSLGGLGIAESVRAYAAELLDLLLTEAPRALGGGGLTARRPDRPPPAHAVDAASRSAYARVWLDLLPHADAADRTFEQIKNDCIVAPCLAHAIPDAIDRMVNNLDLMFPEFLATHAVVTARPDTLASEADFTSAVEAILAARGAVTAPQRARIGSLYRRLGGHGTATSSAVQPRSNGASSIAPERAHEAARRGVAGGGQALPHHERLQASFGRHDLGGVRGHVGGAAADAAAAIGAHAFAVGEDVAFASAPDLHTAAHEAAHVVQQRRGVSLDGGVGRAGDPYEQQADAAADRVVSGQSAEVVLDATVGGGAGAGPAVQRLTAAERSAAREHVVDDVAMEQIAHRIAYLDGDLPPSPIDPAHPHDGASNQVRDGDAETAAAHAGWSVPQVAYVDTLDRDALTALGFDCLRLEFFSGQAGLQFWTLPALAGSAVTPIIAFRGTATETDLAEDTNEAGIGMGQFTLNQAVIASAIHRLGSRGVCATGHSLGGALAQLAACFFPESIVQVVTFQSPGIPTDAVQRILSLPEDERPMADHHRVDGCIVDDAGEAFVPGAVTVYGDDMWTEGTFIDPVSAHTSLPLLSGADADGSRDDWMRAAPAAVDHGLTPSARGTTDDPSLGRWLGAAGVGEEGRRSPVLTGAALGAVAGGAGGPVGAGIGAAVGAGAGAYVHDAATVAREAYSRIWLHEVLPFAEHGYRTLPQLKEVIIARCTEDEIPHRIGTMTHNLTGMFPEYLATNAVATTDPEAMTSLAAFTEAVARQVPLDDARRLRVRNIYLSLGGNAPDDSTAAVSPDGGEVDARDPAAVHQWAERGVAGDGAALPHLETIQRRFGHHDVSGVRAHVGGAAAVASAAIGARAYATGDDVAFAASPDLRQAAHEAAHVVQQRGGDVRLDGGVGRAGDPYEQHADAVADLVVVGDSAQGLLDTMAHRGASGGAAVQRLVDERDAAAVAVVQRLLSSSRPAESVAIGHAIATALEQMRGPIAHVDVSFAHRGETYHLLLPVADARTLCGEVLTAVETPAATTTADAPRTADVPVSAPPPHPAPAPRTTPAPPAAADRPVVELEVSHGREREFPLPTAPTPFGPIGAEGKLRIAVDVGPPAAEGHGHGGPPPPGRISIETADSTSASGAPESSITVEGEGVLRRLIDRDLMGIADHFEISRDHDGLHFSAGIVLPEGELGPLHWQFGFDVVHYDPGSATHPAMSILSPAATVSVELNPTLLSMIGLDVSAHATLEIELRWYPDWPAVWRALSAEFAPYFSGLAGEGAVVGGGAVVEGAAGLGTVGTGAAVGIGLGAALLGAVFVGGVMWSMAEAAEEGRREGLATWYIHEYAVQFGDALFHTRGEHVHQADSVPGASELAAEGRSDARAAVGRLSPELRAALIAQGRVAVVRGVADLLAEQMDVFYNSSILH